MIRIVTMALLALVAGCNVKATEFSKGQFRFAPPANFEEPIWHSGKAPDTRVYFRGDLGDAARLSVAWRKLSIDSPLRPSEEPAANAACARGKLHGLFTGKNHFAEHNSLQSQNEIQRVDVSGIPAALIEYRAMRGNDPQRGFVACIATGQEALLVTYQEPMGGMGFAKAVDALKHTVVR